MSFTPEQVKALDGTLSSSRVKTREQSGRKLSYVEGWWAIAEANRIFGFDGWSRETLELKCVAEKEREVGKDKARGWGVTYTARVRVTVGTLVREGSGTGHGIDRDLGQAHESALKEAETDAMKRALMTFGNPFGLALYDKEQNGVEHGSQPQAAPAAAPTQRDVIHQSMSQPKDPDIEEGVKNWIAKQAAVIGNCERLPELLQWQDEQEDALHRLLRKHPEGHRKIMDQFAARQKYIMTQEKV